MLVQKSYMVQLSALWKNSIDLDENVTYPAVYMYDQLYVPMNHLTWNLVWNC